MACLRAAGGHSFIQSHEEMSNREVTAGVHCNSEQPEIHTSIGYLSSVLIVLDVQEVLEIVNIYTMLSVKNTKHAWKQ